MLGTRRLRLAKQKRYLISEGRKILAQLSQQGSPSQINKENVNVWFAAVEDFLRLTLPKGSALFDQFRGIRKSVTATNNSVPVSKSSQGLLSSPGKLSEEPKKEEISDNPPSPQLREHTTPPRMEANGSESAVSGTDTDKASAALNVERMSATLATPEHVVLTTISIQSNLEANKEDEKTRGLGRSRLRQRLMWPEVADAAIKSVEHTMKHISLGLVHHANQYIITNDYQNREGIDDLVGAFGGSNHYLHVLELHRAYQIPLNLHLSGTLLEALRWYHPGCLAVLQDLAQQGLLELVGSSYGQNIMRFFTHEHNLKQLNEELELYREHLQASPDEIKVFWPPERVWDTQRLASVLTDSQLLNGGYRYVLIDDRLLHPLKDGSQSRQLFDQTQDRRFADFALYQILHGQGLIALPIANCLRHNIPPFDAKGFQKTEKLLRWLATAEPEVQGDLIAIYGDDLEKAAGIGGWDKRGPSQYETFLRWLHQNPWVHPVKLSEWTATHRTAGVKCIDVGSFVEMSNHFGAGEGYENWYFDPQWDAYRSYYSWSEGQVKALSALGANVALIELAWKQLLASSWETAWHTPSSGVHGNPAVHHSAPSPWIKALASHSRHAAVIAAAAAWMQHKDNAAHAYMYDIDNNGEEELIVSNNTLFAVFTPQWGGRLIYLFSIEAEQGKMVIGNPCDDWNWMEALNKYMEIPANHPGALTDVGYEHDRYEPWIEVADGREVRVTLVNRQPGSPAVAMAKELRLAYHAHEIRVTYQLPEALPALTIECGMSPDYLHLLRCGRQSLTTLRQPKVWGYANNGVTVWLRLEDVGPTVFDAASQREFGHGQAFRLIVSGRQFTFWIGAQQLESAEADDPGIEEIRSCTWQ